MRHLRLNGERPVDAEERPVDAQPSTRHRKGTALRRGALAVVLGAIVTAVAVGSATGAIPAADGHIDACYTNANGLLRVIDTETAPDQSCKTSETRLAWNQQGPQGEKGDTGEQGPAGPAGPVGAPEVFFAALNLQYYDNAPGVNPNETKTVLTMDVPAGTYLLQAELSAFNFGRLKGARSLLHCSIPGNTGATYLEHIEDPEFDGTISITSAIDHAGGSMSLKCTNSTPHSLRVEIMSASILATKVASVG